MNMNYNIVNFGINPGKEEKQNLQYDNIKPDPTRVG